MPVESTAERFRAITGPRQKTHFRIDFGKRGVGYTYIRKNACSLFKKLILATSSSARSDPYRDNHPMKFMGEYHRIAEHSLAKLEQHVAVLRDPIERVVSGYLSRFVMLLNGRSILVDNVENALSRPADEVSFEIFVQEYLARQDGDVDVHLVPQYAYLAPITYSHVLSLETLYEDAVIAFGDRRADRFFAQRVNSTEKFRADNGFDASQQTAKELMERHRQTKKFPSKDNFLTPDLEEQLRKLYRYDIDLWNHFQELRLQAGGGPVALDVPSLDLR